MSSKIPDSATKGFADAASYEKHRPSYPLEVVDDLLAKLQVKGINNACIVDVGAGTGKFTEMLAARDEEYTIIAVEPHEEMRVQCLAKKLKGVKIVDGTGNNMPVPTQSADAVVVAQAWHWQVFSEDKLLAESIMLTAQDNAPESWEPRTAWEAMMKATMWSHNDDQPRFRHEKWRQVFEKQVSSSPFTIQTAYPLFSLPLGENSIDIVDWLSPEAIWDRFRSLSQIAVLKGEELEMVRKKVFTAMSAPDVEKNDAGELPLHGRVIYAWSSAVPGAPLKQGG
ncbi:MAG: hypothetical protein LQ341_000185 [Variospora aurantia]|nr:MAG: hypothetical protein LQ341_000185 [Variospora aurantia]